jgi:Arc/MetJ-type ribon-helix-helix transcriptional regulator
MTRPVTVRLPQDLLQRLDTLVPGTHATRSGAVRRAIELYLYRLACERDARLYELMPLTDAEIALADDPKAWSTAPPWQ